MTLYLGVDWGTRRTGLAISDPAGKLALPLAVIEHQSPTEQVAKLLEVMRERGIDAVVIGHPLNMQGTESRSSRQTASFARELTKLTDRPVILWDERRSTHQALAAMREAGIDARGARGKVDQVAATLLLQSYLDQLSPHSSDMNRLNGHDVS